MVSPLEDRKAYDEDFEMNQVALAINRNEVGRAKLNVRSDLVDFNA